MIYSRLLANQQMQSRLILINDMPEQSEAKAMHFLNSSYLHNMQFLTSLQSEAFNLTQCLQQIKSQLDQITKNEASSIIEVKSSSQRAMN